MQAEILLTLKLQQKLFADPRRISLLKHIALSGSISQERKMPVSAIKRLDAINEMNQLSEHILVERATGGKGGGGAVLTRYGQRLIQLYDLLAQIQQKAFDVLSDDDALPLNSLLAAISRFHCKPAPVTNGLAPSPPAIMMTFNSMLMSYWLTEKHA